MQICYDKVAEEEDLYNYNTVIVNVESGVKLGALARDFIKRRNRRI